MRLINLAIPLHPRNLSKVIENYRKLSTLKPFQLEKKDYVFEAKRLDVWARRTGRLGQNVVTFEPKIRVFWPEISVPFVARE